MPRFTIQKRIKDYIAAITGKFGAASVRHTLLTNVIQQICAALIILYLPNILNKADYAQVVYVSVLLSFFAFADAGLSMAYGRVVPALLAQNKHDEIEIWNRTTLGFGFLASAVYSIIIALLYYVRYGNIVNTLLLLPVPFIVFWFSFHISRVNAHGDFRQYRRVNSWRSVASLVVFPLAFVSGLTGWFIATLTATLIGLLSLGKQLLQPLGSPHWALVRQHLREGLTLSSNSVMWMQLLNFARLYASVFYPPEAIAKYGIISAAYQSLSALVISIFLPVMVGIQRRYGESEEKAIAFAGNAIARSLPWIMALAVLAVIFEPPVFNFCFPSYHFHGRASTPMLLCVVFFPFFMVYGSLMVASKRSGQYMMLIITGILLSSAFAWIGDTYHPKRGAGWGQLFGIMGYTLLLFFVVARDARKHKDILRPQAHRLIAAFALCATVIGIRAII